MDSYRQLLECGNGAIADAAMKFQSVLQTHKSAFVSISGGADSDVMLDMCERVRDGTECKVTYDYQDTGLEYRATKAHILELEQRYGISIHRTRADRTIPVCCKQYGQPFMSKMVSQQMERLQSHGFEWEDDPFDVLANRYPGIMSAVKWWCNEYHSGGNVYSSYCIGRNKLLREFVIESPPQFMISAKCCTYAKKNPGLRRAKNIGADVKVVGVRRSEGGTRALVGTCFTHKDDIDTYRPLFWMSGSDRAFYERTFDVSHSDCYEVWGFERTGCVGCPFNKHVFEDIETIAAYEPNMARAARKVFADSYEYTMQYREFRRFMESGGQVRLFT